MVLAVEGHTLFVSIRHDKVDAYDIITEAFKPGFITGLKGPRGLAVFGETLFVADFLAGEVGAYNATTGAAINPSFITSLEAPLGLAVLDNTLFVTNHDSGTVGAYDATTGAAINVNLIKGLQNVNAIAVKSAGVTW